MIKNKIGENTGKIWTVLDDDREINLKSTGLEFRRIKK
ncbi:MAG TPA: hypothetical protein DCQ24_05950 [Bacteroidales bacterium]|nr:hypothetical protein [Bacteroidales bacterium]